MKHGMIILCTSSLLSCVATTSLLGFLTYRFIAARNDREAPCYKDQNMLLIFSLVLADFQCDLGFAMDMIWLYREQIVAPSAGCFIQGWLINVGNLGSGFFFFAIASHTFYNIVYGRKIGLTTLRYCILALWALAVILTIIPIALHPQDIFVTQGSWCTTNTKYDNLRLYFHYLWVFIAEAAVLVMYTITFVVLRKRMGQILSQLIQTSGTNGNRVSKDLGLSHSKISRATMYMILYPVIYIVSTLPLAAGHISSMAGHAPTKRYLLCAGTLMASAGWMNCLLYSFTRRLFPTRRSIATQDLRRSRYGAKSSVTRGTDVETELEVPGSRYRELPSPVASTDDIMGTGLARKGSPGDSKDVIMETTWEVQFEPRGRESLKDEPVLGHSSFVIV